MGDIMTEEKYKEHVKKGWCFAQETANEMTTETDLRSKFYHYLYKSMVLVMP